MRRVSLWPLLLLAVLAGWWLLSRPSGVAAASTIDPTADPIQQATDRTPFRVEKYRLTPRASYDISAVVGGVARYWLDPFASLAPVDAVLTWGELPEPPYLGRVNYDQMSRFYFWSTRAADLDLRYIATHSANVHLLPATANLRRALTGLDAGDRVRLRGLLVDVDRDDGAWLRTSTVRTDTGAGACEVFWVEQAQVDDTVYR